MVNNETNVKCLLGPAIGTVQESSAVVKLLVYGKTLAILTLAVVLKLNLCSTIDSHNTEAAINVVNYNIGDYKQSIYLTVTRL